LTPLHILRDPNGVIVGASAKERYLAVRDAYKASEMPLSVNFALLDADVMNEAPAGLAAGYTFGTADIP
jgi:hypothetical protein